MDEEYSTIGTIWDDLLGVVGDGITHYIDSELNPVTPLPAAVPVAVRPPSVVNGTNTLIVMAVLGGLAILYFTRAK